MLCALPRSKSLRFRFSGTPASHRLGWACVLCPSQVQAAQVTRCLASTHSPGVMHLIIFPIPAAQFPGCTVGAQSQVYHVSPLGSWSLWPSRWMSTIQDPRKTWVSNWEPAHSLVEGTISGAEIAPCLLALAVTHLSLCLWLGRGRSAAG